MEKIGIVLILILLAGTFFYFNPQYLPMAIGFSTLSIGTTDFTTNDPNGFLQGELFVFTVRQGGLSQKAVGTITANQIQADGKKASKGFTLEITNTKQECVYPISVDYTSGKVYLYGFKKYPMWSSENCSAYGEYVAEIKPAWSLDKYCIYRNPLSSYSGRLKDQANYRFNTIWKLAIEGEEPIVSTMSNIGETKVKFDNVAYAIWQGNLVTGETCPNPSSHRVMAVYAFKKWVLVNEDYWDDYKNYERSFLQNLRSLNADAIENQIKELNNKAGKAVAFLPDNHPFLRTGGGQGYLANKESVKNAMYILPLAKQIQFPVFTFYVKADKLGVFTPTVKPSIISAKSIAFKTGELGSIELTFKNESEVGGTFHIWAECPAGFSMYGTTIERYVGANQTATVFIPITGQCGTTTTKTCTVYVKGTELKDSKRVSVTCKPQQVCNPNQIVCINDAIYKCNADGTDYILIENCKSQGKVCGTDALGNLICVTSGTTPDFGDSTGGLLGGFGDILKGLLSGGSDFVKALMMLGLIILGIIAIILIIWLIIRKIIGI